MAKMGNVVEVDYRVTYPLFYPPLHEHLGEASYVHSLAPRSES